MMDKHNIEKYCVLCWRLLRSIWELVSHAAQPKPPAIVDPKRTVHLLTIIPSSPSSRALAQGHAIQLVDNDAPMKLALNCCAPTCVIINVNQFLLKVANICKGCEEPIALQIKMLAMVAALTTQSPSQTSELTKTNTRGTFRRHGRT